MKRILHMLKSEIEPLNHERKDIHPLCLFRSTNLYKYNLYALKAGDLSEQSISSALLNCIAPITGRKDYIAVPAIASVTKKPIGVTLGEGRGNVVGYTARVKNGCFLLSFDADNDIQAQKIFRKVSIFLYFTFFRFKKVSPYLFL